MHSETISLFDLAESELYGSHSSKYTIPNIQRGLVWNATRMELLWDSILREFPIGALMVLNQENSPGEILDGQQRANAIVTGYSLRDLIGISRPRSILWLDLKYQQREKDSEKRLFGIYLTNISHPWGFSEDGTKLSAYDRRESLRLAYGGKKEEIPPKPEWDIRRFIPYNSYKNAQQSNTSFLPIPLPIIVAAAKGKTDEETDMFRNEIIKEIRRFAQYAPYWAENYQAEAEAVIKEIAIKGSPFSSQFIRLNDYRIAVNFMEKTSDVEILFNRINTKGIPMSKEDLAYAAVKHNGAKLAGCPEIGLVIRRIASGHMLEQNLAQIAFRYCLSDKEIKGFIDAGFIRTITENNEDREEIINHLVALFENSGHRLEQMINSVSEIIRLSPYQDYCPLPTFIEADIANNSTSLYVLAMELSYRLKHNILIGIDGKFIQALIFYIHLFSTNKNFIINTIHILLVEKDKISKEDIQNTLRDLISAEYLFSMDYTYSFKQFKPFRNEEFNSSWTLDSYSNDIGFRVLKSLFSYDGSSSENSPAKFMLKIAQRYFYKEVFGDYDPSKREYWEDINRPWDHDHIIPKSWGDNTVELWRSCVLRWINCMGNIADIPFEENREKRDKSDWDYYDDIKESYNGIDPLFYDPIIKTIDRKSIERGMLPEISKFVELTKERFFRISDDFLSIFKVLGLGDKISPAQEKRKKLLMYIKEKYHPDWKLFYSYDVNGKDFPLSLADVVGWQSPWISLMDEKMGNHWAESITAYNKTNEVMMLERGKRKASDSSVTDTDGTLWKKDSYFKIEIKGSPFDDNGMLGKLPELFVDGANSFKKKTGLAFRADSNALVSFFGNIMGSIVLAYLYDYYNYYHCWIHIQGDVFPQPFIDFAKKWGFELNIKNKTMDKNLKKNKSKIDEVASAYDDFVNIISDLNNWHTHI